MLPSFLPPGLGGELRGSKRIDDRVKEAVKLGFTRIIIPAVKKTMKASDEEDKLHHIRNNSSSSKQLKSIITSPDYQRYILECSNILEVVALAFVNPAVVSSMKQKRLRKRRVVGGSLQQPLSGDDDDEYSTNQSFDDITSGRSRDYI